jgi:hypothetical protein
LICEQINEKNIILIKDRLKNTENVSVLELQQTYDNPLDFNLIESYGKNVCLSKAKGIYSCMTSADQMFSEQFFIFIKDNLKPKTFYRFATYEVATTNVAKILMDNDIPSLIKYCEINKTRLCNPGCFDTTVFPISPIRLGQKSGDIMIYRVAKYLFI